MVDTAGVRLDASGGGKSDHSQIPETENTQSRKASSSRRTSPRKEEVSTEAQIPKGEDGRIPILYIPALEEPNVSRNSKNIETDRSHSAPLKLSERTRDTELETIFQEGHTIHICRDAPFRDARKRREVWKRQRHIGRGGFADVWLEECVAGKAEQGPKLRAVKEFRMQTKYNILNYARELDAFAKFSHQKYMRNFVRSYGWYRQGQSVLLSLEYMPLGDLGNYLVEQGEIPESDTQEITFQILSGLSLMHHENYAHRDLTPRNILIQSRPPVNRWWIKLSDFGLSKRVDDDLPPSTFQGTFGFIAPELHGLRRDPQGKINRNEMALAADIWALGAIIFQMLMNRPAFADLGVLATYFYNGGQFTSTRIDSFKLSGEAKSFICRSLAGDYNGRLTVDQALQHAWIRQPEVDEEIVFSEAAGSVDENTAENEDWTAELGGLAFRTWTVSREAKDGGSAVEQGGTALVSSQQPNDQQQSSLAETSAAGIVYREIPPRRDSNVGRDWQREPRVPYKRRTADDMWRGYSGHHYARYESTSIDEPRADPPARDHGNRDDSSSDAERYKRKSNADRSNDVLYVSEDHAEPYFDGDPSSFLYHRKREAYFNAVVKSPDGLQHKALIDAAACGVFIRPGVHFTDEQIQSAPNRLVVVVKQRYNYPERLPKSWNEGFEDFSKGRYYDAWFKWDVHPRDSEDYRRNNFLIGLATFKQKNFIRAEQFLRQSLEGSEQGLESDVGLVARFYLALSLSHQEKFRHANQVFKEVLAAWRALVGEGSEERLNAHYWLGQTYFAQNQLEKAISEMRVVWQAFDRRGYEGAAVPKWLALQWIGRALIAMQHGLGGDELCGKEGLQCLSDATKGLINSLGPANSNTLQCRYWLCNALITNSLITNSSHRLAESEVERGLEICRDALGKEHDLTEGYEKLLMGLRRKRRYSAQVVPRRKLSGITGWLARIGRD